MNAPPHPADFLNEVLMPATGRSDGEVARLLGISLPMFYTILTREKPLSPTTAAMLGRLFNTGEGFWLKMQADYDRFMAPQNVVEAGLVPSEAPARAPALAAPVSLRQLPKAMPVTFPDAAEQDEVAEFPAHDVALSWGRLIQGNGRSSIG